MCLLHFKFKVCAVHLLVMTFFYHRKKKGFSLIIFLRGAGEDFGNEGQLSIYTSFVTSAKI